MIYLDDLWGVPRSVRINGKLTRVPFAVDLPSSLVAFLNQWIADSGESWTASRMKSLTVWAINILAGNQDFSEPWFRTIRYKGFRIPKLELFKFLIDNRHHVTRVRLVLTILKSYRLKIWGSPSLDSVDLSPKVPETSKYVRLLRYYCDLPSVPESVLVPEVMVNTRKSYANDFGVTRPGPYGLLDEAFPAEIRYLYEDLNRDPQILGKLVPIPDKGKWRVILVGHWAIQLQTKRLADWLRSWLWRQPEIASGNQDRMSKFAIASLEKGRTMLSIDLSQATDRLSRDLQIKLLISMGVPERYFRFLKLPAVYDPKDFPDRPSKDRLKKIWYTTGQPMGLFLSFPMFELMHYLILKFVTATTDADFTICGDDVMIACHKNDAPVIFNRYSNLIERFGGSIARNKTLISDKACEGVGALFLKGYPKELRIPSGKLSALEASSPGTWLHCAIKEGSEIGRAIHYSWLSSKEYKEYSYQNRRSLNERAMLEDLGDWALEAVQALAEHESYPQKWYSWEEAPPGTRMDNPLFPEEAELPTNWEYSKTEKVQNFRWITQRKYHEALVSHKIITLYKESQDDSSNRNS